MSSQLHPNFHYEIQDSELGQTRQALCRTLGDLETANQVLRSREQHYPSIRLCRTGEQNEYAEVQIERNGEWITVIRELAGNNFYHMITTSGIHDEIRRHLLNGGGVKND